MVKCCIIKGINNVLDISPATTKVTMFIYKEKRLISDENILMVADKKRKDEIWNSLSGGMFF